jgi:hypothetical protein
LESILFSLSHSIYIAFKKYLTTRETIDVIIDGANVGYADQNFAGAAKHVDYRQIDWVVQHFVEQKKSVLLILHARHFSSGLMPKSMEHLKKSWLDSGVLYITPPGMNDDWFWLEAALDSNALVVTNDEMRDHFFQMLAPRSFLRWKERHLVKFDFGTWEGRSSGRHVDLHYPPVYSRRIQQVEKCGLAVPLVKRGDERRFMDGVHQEEDAPDYESYLTIRPKRPEKCTIC